MRDGARRAPEPSVPLELPPVEAIASVPTEELPAVAFHLTALQGAVAVAWRASCAAPPPAPSAAVPDDYLTTEEVAALLKVSPKWLYRRREQLPFFGKALSRRELRWSRKRLEAYMARKSA